MDETKKALLSIELDTSALTQNTEKAKTSVSALSEELKKLKEAGKDSGEAFDKLAEQFKKASEKFTESIKTIKDLKDAMLDLDKTQNQLNNTQANVTSTKAAADEQKKLSKAIADTAKIIKDSNNATKATATNDERNKEIEKLTASYIKLNATERDNAQIGGVLEERIAALRALNKGLHIDEDNLNNKFKTGSQILQVHQKIIDTSTGSISNSKTAVKALTTEFFNLSEAQRDNANIGGVLKSKIAELQANIEPLANKSIKEFIKGTVEAGKSIAPLNENLENAFKAFKTLKDGAVNTYESFTDFKTKVKALADEHAALGENTGFLAKNFPQLSAGFEVATGGAKNFGKALLGTGIGAIIMAVSLLIDYLQKFQPIVDLTEQVVAGFNGAIDAGKHVLDEFFGSIKSVGDFFGKIGEVIKHPIDAFSKLGKAMEDAAIKTAKLKKAQQELDDEVKKSGVESAENAAKIAELKLKAQTADLETRKKIQKQIADIEKAETNEHEKNVKQQVQITVDKVAAVAGLTKQQIGDIDNLTSKKIDELAISKHLNEEQVKSLREAVKQMADLRKEEAEKSLKVLTSTEKSLNEHQVKKQKIRSEAHKTEKTEQQQRGEQIVATNATINLKVETDDEATERRNAEAKKLFADKAAKDKLAADKAMALSAKLEAENEQKLNAAKLNKYEGYFSQLQGLFGKHTIASKAAFVAQKAIALAEIVINTQRQISAISLATAKNVANDAEFGPFLGPVFAAKDIAAGVVQTVEAIVSGAIQGATVVATAVQGFARGGYYKSDGMGTYLTGPGNGTSDSINARLSNGESIINARSTEMFAPVLSAINQAGGGRAFNVSNPGGGYALGGMFNGSNTLNDGSGDLAQTRAINDMVKTLAANMPRQVLVVEDVQASLQNKVMLQNMSNF